MTSIGSDIGKASEILRRGGLVAIPTETVYGLSANALNAEAVARIFEAKKRPSFDPLIVHLSPAQDPLEYVNVFPETAQKLADHFWPGPLTLVLPKKSHIPDIVTSGLNTVGIRKPQHEITQILLNTIDFPLAAPSANLFGKVSPTRPQHVLDQLGDSVDYILDGGECQIGLESTIIGWEEEKITIYRLGGATLEEIESLVGDVSLRTHSSSKPSAPGMLTSHYSPAVTLSLAEPPSEAKNRSDIGLLRFSHKLQGFPEDKQWVLSEGEDLNEAAKNLFRILRELDNFKLDTVFVELVPSKGLGLAINDRLKRACAAH